MPNSLSMLLASNAKKKLESGFKTFPQIKIANKNLIREIRPAIPEL